MLPTSTFSEARDSTQTDPWATYFRTKDSILEEWNEEWDSVLVLSK